MFFLFFKHFVIILSLLISVAFLTLLERKVLGIIGVRLGPYKVFLVGLIQPISDALKLALKQDNLISNSSNFMFSLVGLFFIVSSMRLWTVGLLFTKTISLKLDYLFLILVLSLNTLIIMVMGWVSYSKFSLIGSVRSVTQAISYESLFIIVFLVFIIVVGSFSNNYYLNDYNLFFVFPVSLFFWLISMLAEMGRTPYDFSEGERELVRGFNTEFGSKTFALIFLSEYINIIFFCVLTSVIFFYSLSIFLVSFFIFWVIWIRSVLPRSRFDFLMGLAWKFLIPYFTLLLIFLLFFCFW